MGNKTVKVRVRSLKRLKKFIADDHHMKRWARAMWEKCCTNPETEDPADPFNCPYSRHDDKMTVYNRDTMKLEVIAPFCSSRPVSWDTACGTEYDIECDGHALECWEAYLRWSVQKSIERLEASLLPCPPSVLRKRPQAVVELITQYGMIDGAHHKQWLLDQTIQTLLGPKNYKQWLARYNGDPDYENWDTGIAP